MISVEEKKVTKISIATFFLIFAIVVIGIMGYFLYTSNIKTADMMANERELNTKIAKLEDEILSKQNQIQDEKNNNNKTSWSGIYVGDAEIEPGTTPDGETKVRLYLYENGSFKYEDSPGLSSGHVGYYTINENDLVLHEIVECANDIGRTITNNTISLKINKDNTITDSKLKAVLKRTSDQMEEKSNVISTELKNALNNNSLQ